MNIIRWVMQWFKRRRERREQVIARRELLATPGVDLLVQRVMDAKYGTYGWRVRFDNRMDWFVLEAQVTPPSGTPYWGLIGPLESEHTREWLRAGGKPPEISHAKLAPYKLESPIGYEGPYDHMYVDTEPGESS